MRQAEGRVARREHFCASAYLVGVPLWDSKATPAPRLREGVWRLITWVYLHTIVISLALSG